MNDNPTTPEGEVAQEIRKTIESLTRMGYAGTAVQLFGTLEKLVNGMVKKP